MCDYSSILPDIEKFGEGYNIPINARRFFDFSSLKIDDGYDFLITGTNKYKYNNQLLMYFIYMAEKHPDISNDTMFSFLASLTNIKRIVNLNTPLDTSWGVSDYGSSLLVTYVETHNVPMIEMLIDYDIHILEPYFNLCEVAILGARSSISQIQKPIWLNPMWFHICCILLKKGCDMPRVSRLEDEFSDEEIDYIMNSLSQYKPMIDN